MSESDEGVSFTKRDEPAKEPASPPAADPSGDPAAEAEFDPYRFGKPEHPIPAEYAPPGYTGPTVSTPPANPYAGTGDNPFANPPGTPYAPPGGTPYGGDPYGTPPRHGNQPYGEQPYGGPPAGGQPGQSPYGAPSPYAYGGPVPPPFHGYPQPRTGNGKAIAALVLGILSIILCFFSVLDILLVIPGLVFSLVALNEAKGRPGSGRGMAIAGLVCTIIGALLATLLTVFYVQVSKKCGDLQDQRSEFENCIRHEVL